MSARFGLYYAPKPADPLHAAASAWLGRDAETGAVLPQPPIPGIEEITADPRGYGFHGTLKAPFRLSVPFEEMRTMAVALADRTAPFDLPPLKLTDLRGFLALTESTPCPALYDFADACVEQLDPARAPLTEAELARRKPDQLTEQKRDYLMRWGYPLVFKAFQFHMTLTRRMTPDEQARILPAVTEALGETPAMPRRVTELCLFSQASAGAPFLIAERLPLRG